MNPFKMSKKEADSPLVAIIVLNYNNLSDTEECVRSVEQIAYPNYRLIVVDNAGDQDNGETLEAAYAQKHIVLRNEKNLGYAGGNNVGIRYALNELHAPYVLILNNDTIVTSSFLEAMVKSAQKNPSVGMVAAKILQYPKEKNQIDSIGLKLTRSGLPYKRTSENDPLFCPSGACALYTAQMLRDAEQNGEFFDEDFFLYGEDIDLGFRGVLFGYDCVFAQNAIIYHKGSATTKERSPLSIYYGHRNTPLMIVKDFPLPLFLRYGLSILFYQIITPLYYLFIDPRNIRTVVRAKFDAVKSLPQMLSKRKYIQKKKTILAEKIKKILQ
ncbi:MAG TPA: glycosyltransferase family 2 protein [Patescibacteria group bacterium]|nr:glycosyltransferase family 2 protein [Patescibacteria group bacterium]